MGRELRHIHRILPQYNMNGMILEALEEIPAAGTRVRIDQYDIDILDVQDNMIKQVKILPVKPIRESISE